MQEVKEVKEEEQIEVYVVKTVREYEGSWIEKIFLKREDAEEFINTGRNKFNDELKIFPYSVY